MSPQDKVPLDTLRAAPLDRWIALSEDEARIVAIGSSYTEVSELSDVAGEDVVILKTPKAWEPISVSTHR